VRLSARSQSPVKSRLRGKTRTPCGALLLLWLSSTLCNMHAAHPQPITGGPAPSPWQPEFSQSFLYPAAQNGNESISSTWRSLHHFCFFACFQFPNSCNWSFCLFSVTTTTTTTSFDLALSHSNEHLPVFN